jgi:cyanophycin synthetase
VTCPHDETAVTGRPGFEARLRKLFPAVGALRTGGPVSLAHVLEAAALALQEEAGCPVSFSRTQATSSRRLPGRRRVQREAVGRLAFELAQQLIAATLDPEAGFDVDAAISRLRESRRGRAPGSQHGLHRAGRGGTRHPVAAA